MDQKIDKAFDRLLETPIAPAKLPPPQRLLLSDILLKRIGKLNTELTTVQDWNWEAIIRNMGTSGFVELPSTQIKDFLLAIPEAALRKQSDPLVNMLLYVFESCSARELTPSYTILMNAHASLGRVEQVLSIFNAAKDRGL